jgi:uncharacterized membrane protein
MRRWVIVSALLTVAAFAASSYIYFFNYDRLAERVPIHWNIHGEPDGWIAKENVLGVFMLLPSVMAGFVGLTLLLPWLSPKHFDVDRFRATYGYMMALVNGLFGYIHVITLVGSLEREKPFNIGRWLVGGIFLFLALIGNVLGQVRRNFWMGVRTPWTLANETVWIQTHRVAAWLFTAGGVAGAIAVFAGVNLLWCFIVLMAVIVPAPIIYSLVMYKRLERQGKA